MYQLWNKLFGWDYIHWENSADQGIARIHKTGGKVWFWRYKITNVMDYIDTPTARITFLTCEPEKYGCIQEEGKTALFDNMKYG